MNKTPQVRKTPKPQKPRLLLLRQRDWQTIIVSRNEVILSISLNSPSYHLKTGKQVCLVYTFVKSGWINLRSYYCFGQLLVQICLILATDKLTCKWQARHFLARHFDRVFRALQASLCFKCTAHVDLTKVTRGNCSTFRNYRDNVL